MADRGKTIKSQRALYQWLEKNNPGGFDFSLPPPREMIEAAFPEWKGDKDQIDYFVRKPSRIYENFWDEMFED